MKEPGGPEARAVDPSEEGFLVLAGRRADLPLRDTMMLFRDLISSDVDWADSRKTRFRRQSSTVQVAMLVFTGLSTIVLGIDEIPHQTAIALPMVATVTALGTLEAFFNWRSRWVLMEEARYRLNRLRDEIDYYLVTTPSAEVQRDRLDAFFQEQQATWGDVSRRWIEFRMLGNAPQGAAAPDGRGAA